MTASSITRGGVAKTTTVTTAMRATAAILLLAVSFVSAHTGGFQSGPSPGSVYAGGLHYDADEDTVYLTGSHYNIGFQPHDGTANDLMQGTELDGSSSCFVAKLDVSDNDEMEAADLESFHTLTNWKSYGDPGVMETCAAITTDDHNQAFVVGSVAKGGFFHKFKEHKIAGLTAVLTKDELDFVNAAIATTDDMGNSNYGKKHLLYPMSVIHSNTKNGDGEQKNLYVAALTSTDHDKNPDAASLQEPDMQKIHMYGTSFFVSVLKIKFKLNNKHEPQLEWIQSFPVDNDLNTGAPPPVFIGGMLKQQDINGNSHLLIAGSTRGAGKGYGASEADTDDEDGFIMQLSPLDGSFLAHSRHQAKNKKNKKQNLEDQTGTNNLREGTGSDDFIRGICHADPQSDNPSVDEFYIVGGTKGDMTTNEQGTQNALDEVNAGFQFGVGVEQKYRDLWTRDESLMPFLRRVSFQKQLGPVWTTQWAAMPSKEAQQRASGGPSKTNAYAMDCVVDSVNKNVYVVGTVLKGAAMTQGDVEMINQGGDDLWVAKVDGRTGNVHWMTQLGNYGDETPARHKSIALNTDGNLIIYGDTTSNLYRARSEDTDTASQMNQGNDDDDEFPYENGQTRDNVSDMFLMVINGQTGAVDDQYYMGGTSSASVTGSVDGVPRQTTPPRPPPTNDIPMKDENSGDPTMKDKNASTMNETKTKSSGKGIFGKIIGILFGILAVGFGLYALSLYYQKKKHVDSQKSTIFQCLQKFDVEDIDLRRSPPGGWHGTYMNQLAYGVNKSGVNKSENNGGSEVEPLGGAGMNESTNYEDQKVYNDNEPSLSDPSLGGGGSRSGYKDNFEIGGEEDEPDEVDIRLEGKDLV